MGISRLRLTTTYAINVCLRPNGLALARLTGILPLHIHPAVTPLEAECRSRTGLAYVGEPSDQGAG